MAICATATPPMIDVRTPGTAVQEAACYLLTEANPGTTAEAQRT
jgi:hypothetical protein